MISPKAFIFDLDGVLTDTARYHFMAWKELADELGMRFDEKDNERLKGVSRLRSFEIILEINGLENRYSTEEKNRIANLKNERYVKLIERITPADLLPGIPDFLADAKSRGLLLAVASASRNANRVLQLLQIVDVFDYVSDANFIKNTKPDPEVFLDCAKNLGVAPKDCVGFEDAQAGIEAIHAAGMFSVGINVEVTSLAPDYALKSTRGLNVDKVLNAGAESASRAFSRRQPS